MDKPLVSIIVLAHNSFKYLLSSIDSILEQSFENIQLIICDDCSSKFSAEALVNRLTSNRNEKFHQIILYETEVPAGKTKQLYQAFHKYCQGNYMMVMEAGDVFCEKDCIERLVESIGIKDDMVDLLISQVYLYDRWLKRCDKNVFTSSHLDLIIEKKRSELLLESSKDLRLPLSSFFFKSLFFENLINEVIQYKECTSWALQLKVLKSNANFLYSGFTSVKHVSEEDRKMLNNGEYEFYLKRKKEDILCYEYELLNTCNQFNNIQEEIAENYQCFKTQYDNELRNKEVIISKINAFNKKQENKINYATMLKKIKKQKNNLYKYSRKKYILFLCIWSFLFLCICVFNQIFSQEFMQIVFLVLFFISFIFLITLIALNFAFKFKKELKQLLKRGKL